MGLMASLSNSATLEATLRNADPGCVFPYSFYRHSQQVRGGHRVKASLSSRSS